MKSKNEAIKSLLKETKKLYKETTKPNDKIEGGLLSIKVGDIIKPERRLKTVINKNDKVIVFFDNRDDIDYKFIPEKIEIDSDHVLRQFKILKLKIDSKYIKNKRMKLLEQLGLSLFNALSAKENRLNFFISVEKQINETQTSDEIRSNFVALSICYTLGISITLLFLYTYIVYALKLEEDPSKITQFFLNSVNNAKFEENIKYIFCCLIGGCIGACFSVITRKDINLPDKISLFNGQILSQCCYGMISGVILYTIVRAELVMSFLDNGYQLFTFSFISGFSERLIPSVISKLERETIKKQQSEGSTA